MPLRLLRTILLLTLCVTAGAARGQQIEDRPDGIEGVGVDEKLGGQIPLDLTFYDEHGRPFPLADLFNGDLPVILSLNYSSCPMLCRVQLNGLVEGLKEMEWTAGKEFHVVSVSIDPRETPERAKKTEELYLSKYDRPGSAGGWHFLTGKQQDILKLADSVGFRYKFLPDEGEFANTAAAMVCTPDGVVSRYLYGVLFEPATLRLSLVEAGQGQVGSAMDQVLLFCFQYDHTKGRYAPVARKIMSFGAGVTVLLLGACLLPFWLLRKHSADSAPDAVPPESPEPQAT
ncbi:MAG: SCO family protein [Planctomycetales bacterium]|nr:SCO family protein [Planctomycetales bacterium]